MASERGEFVIKALTGCCGPEGVHGLAEPCSNSLALLGTARGSGKAPDTLRAATTHSCSLVVIDRIDAIWNDELYATAYRDTALWSTYSTPVVTLYGASRYRKGSIGTVLEYTVSP